MINKDKFLDLINVILTITWYTFNFQFYQQTDGVAKGKPTSSTIIEIYTQTRELAVISAALFAQKVLERFVDDVYFILKCTYLEKFFHHINNHQNMKFTVKNKRELAFLHTSLKLEEWKDFCISIQQAYAH